MPTRAVARELVAGDLHQQWREPAAPLAGLRREVAPLLDRGRLLSSSSASIRRSTIRCRISVHVLLASQ
jgi:hypothetical protein